MVTEDFNEYIKPSRNFVAKHCRKFNKHKVERDRKKDYTRKGKNRWEFINDS